MSRDYHDALIDQMLREILGGDRPRDMTARVLAQAKLMDKFRRRNWWLSGLAAAAAAALAIGLTMYWPQEYPSPQAEGVLIANGSQVQRGVQIEADTDGGIVELGGYVHISMAPQTALTLGGARYQERVFLDEGNLTVNVQKKRGAFDVVVGPATVHVTGTQFSIGVVNENTPTARLKKMVVSVGEGKVQVEGVAAEGTVPVSLTAGDKREFVLSAAPRVLPQLRAGAGLLAAAQEGARAGSRGGAGNRILEAQAARGAGSAPGATTRNTTRPIPATTRPQVAASGPAPVRLISTPGNVTRYGKLRRSGDLYYLETSDGNNFFMYQKGAVTGTHGDWLALALDQSTRVAWSEGQVTSVVQGATAPK